YRRLPRQPLHGTRLRPRPNPSGREARRSRRRREVGWQSHTHKGHEVPRRKLLIFLREPSCLRGLSFWKTYALLPTARMHSSSTSAATSASSLVTTSGGHSRIVLGPHPRNKIPFSNAISTMRSRSAAPYSFVTLSFTMSTPIISPRPR